jgi:hypothetical protein
MAGLCLRVGLVYYSALGRAAEEQGATSEERGGAADDLESVQGDVAEGVRVCATQSLTSLRTSAVLATDLSRSRGHRQGGRRHEDRRGRRFQVQRLE